MADNEGARETGEAIVMCTSPDVFLTNGTPVPYQIIARLDTVRGFIAERPHDRDVYDDHVERITR